MMTAHANGGPMAEVEDQAISRAFAAIPERNTGDVILRTTQQHHVQLSVMADTKANILITVSSIILTLILGKMSDPALRAAMVTLACFIFTALLLAVITVLPKYRPIRVPPGAPLPPRDLQRVNGQYYVRAEVTCEESIDAQ
jgi:hypothetical protein